MATVSAVSRDRKGRNDGENLLLLYLREINRIPLLTRAEEEKLARDAARGNQIAKEKLARANLRFVVNVAKRYQHRGLPLEDLISEGNIGLLHAIERYDVEKGYHFISYAVWWIRQAILTAISEKSRMIRLPAGRVSELAEAEQSSGPLTPRAARLLAITREPLSLDAPIGAGDDASSFGETVEDRTRPSQEDRIVENALREDIEAVLGTLARKEAAILRARFGLDGRRALSLRELGSRYKLTKERIRQIEKRAIRQLQKSERSPHLRSYMESSGMDDYPFAAEASDIG
ncbi:MAG TPA: RNA polymerase sigma factor RpoD/SigA [Spirochaetia bacterium]